MHPDNATAPSAAPAAPAAPGATVEAAPGPEKPPALSYDLDGLPIITDADTFIWFAAQPDISEELRNELVLVAGDGPLRPYGKYDGRPVDEATWYTAALSIRDLTETDLFSISASAASGPSRDLSVVSRLIFEHPACTDAVAASHINAAWCRRNPSGEAERVPSVLGELDQLGHPLAAAWRVTQKQVVENGYPLSRDELTAAIRRMRQIGPAAARAAERLSPDWSGTLDDLLDLAVAVAADARTETAGQVLTHSSVNA